MKKRNKVDFTHVDIYYFGRCLGKDKVPESGNNPLGMEICHFNTSRIYIQKKNKDFLTTNGDSIITSTPHSKNGQVSFILSPNESSGDMDSLQSVFSIDYTSKSLQPMNPRQRIKCLKDAGVEMIKDEMSANESKYLIKLRQERQQVGCKCTGSGPCDPIKCGCSKEGIPCQSDGNTFPCKCGPNCANQFGKRSYCNLRVKYHYNHTLMRDMSECYTPVVTEHGDCKLCNDINEDVLNEMFAVTVETKRKRTANVRNLDIGKVQKSQKPNFDPLKSLPEDISPVVVSTVLTVSSSNCLPLIYDNILSNNHASHFSEFNGNKENMCLEDADQSPEKDLQLSSQIQIPKLLLSKHNDDSWVNNSPFLLMKNESRIKEIVLEETEKEIIMEETKISKANSSFIGSINVENDDELEEKMNLVITETFMENSEDNLSSIEKITTEEMNNVILIERITAEEMDNLEVKESVVITENTEVKSPCGNLTFIDRITEANVSLIEKITAEEMDNLEVKESIVITENTEMKSPCENITFIDRITEANMSLIEKITAEEMDNLEVKESIVITENTEMKSPCGNITFIDQITEAKLPFIKKITSEEKDNGILIENITAEEMNNLNVKESILITENTEVKSPCENITFIDRITEANSSVNEGNLYFFEKNSTERVAEMIENESPDLERNIHTRITEIGSNDTEPSSRVNFWDSIMSDNTENVALLPSFSPEISKLNQISLSNKICTPEHTPNSILTSLDLVISPKKQIIDRIFTVPTINVQSILGNLSMKNSDKFRQFTNMSNEINNKKPKRDRNNFRATKRRHKVEQKQTEMIEDHQETECELIPFVDIGSVDESGQEVRGDASDV